MAKTYYVYMMTNSTKSVLYTGVTSDLYKRVYEHKNHLKGKFTDRYNCEILVYYQETNLIDVALNREKQIKGLLRRKKDSLINADNPNWKDLAEGWYT